MVTEARRTTAVPIDRLAPAEAVRGMIAAQCEAASVVARAEPELQAAAQSMASVLSAGGRVFYCGAGSSGLMALSDALELSGTFGIDRKHIVAVTAGGRAGLVQLLGSYEDDRGLGDADLLTAGVARGDCVIVVSASGSTPYALGIANRARHAGATLIAIANNRDAPLLEASDVAILLETPPEVIAGSTRLGAGTAQKIALNTISTLAGILLGHVHDGMMVNLLADNEKLHARAARMVAEIAGVDGAAAIAALAQAHDHVKEAILVARGAASGDEARHHLSANNNNLRRALQALDAKHKHRPVGHN